MNIKYIVYPKYKEKIKSLYFEAFPKNERFPFWILKHSIKKGKSTLIAILDDDKFIGMEYIVNCDDSCYLMFFAINKELRNKNYGSKTLMDLKLKYKTIFLSIEKPCDEMSSRRKQFYIRNGFYETNKFYEDNGVIFEVLCTNQDYIITEEVLKIRYDNMTNSRLIKYIIGKRFNTNKIKFIK